MFMCACLASKPSLIVAYSRNPKGPPFKCRALSVSSAPTHVHALVQRLINWILWRAYLYNKYHECLHMLRQKIDAIWYVRCRAFLWIIHEHWNRQRHHTSFVDWYVEHCWLIIFSWGTVPHCYPLQEQICRLQYEYYTWCLGKWQGG